MKRFLTLILAVMMIASTMVFSTNAAGTLIHSDNFDEGFIPRNWITARETCHFEWDKFVGCIHGYNDAKVLQSNFGGKYDMWWAQFYSSMDFQIRGYDDLPEQEGRTHSVTMWYNDLMETGVAADDVTKRGANYTYEIEIETGKATLTKDYKFDYYDENGNKQSGEVKGVIAEGNINTTIEIGERAPWYEIGMRVTSGKIECYFNQQLILSSSAEESTEKIGHVSVNSVDETVGSEKSAILFFNGGNWMAFDNFEVWTADYDFQASVVYGDADSDGEVKLGDVSLILKHVAGWSDLTIDLTAVDVNVDNAVNLTDASTILKYIAGWEGVVLGPQA